MEMIIIIIISVSIAVYHGYYKKYLYEDEVLSYTVSNSQNGEFFNLQSGQWYNGRELYNNLIADREHIFDWNNVITNIRNDPHPPLYYLVLHGVCSFFPGQFSKWYGLSINLVLFVLWVIFFYCMLCELFPDRRYFPACLSLVVAISACVLELIIFIRMYVLFMAVTMLCMFWHVCAIKREPFIKQYIHLSFITTIGTLSHYFYLIIAFFCATFFCIFLIRQKRLRQLIYYIIAMVISALSVLILWSRIIKQLFESDPSSDTFSQGFSLSTVLNKLLIMSRNLNGDILYGKLKIFILMIVIYAAFLFITNRKKLLKAFACKTELMMIIVVSMMSFIVISILTPYLTTRYISPLFPFVILIFVLTMEQPLNDVFRYQIIGYVMIALFLMDSEINMLRNGLVDNNRQIIEQVTTENADALCLFEAGIIPEENVFELGKYNRIFVYDESNIEEAREELLSADKIVMYVNEDTDPGAYVEAIMRINPELKNYDRLYVAYYSTCYYFGG